MRCRLRHVLVHDMSTTANDGASNDGNSLHAGPAHIHIQRVTCSSEGICLQGACVAMQIHWRVFWL